MLQQTAVAMQHVLPGLVPHLTVLLSSVPADARGRERVVVVVAWLHADNCSQYLRHSAVTDRVQGWAHIILQVTRADFFVLNVVAV